MASMTHLQHSRFSARFGLTTPVALAPMALASGGALMTKDRLLELAWSRGEVADESLTRCIYSLRKHLRADKGFIKTIYGKGYRFTCPVRAGNQPRAVVHVCPRCGQASNV